MMYEYQEMRNLIFILQQGREREKGENLAHISHAFYAQDTKTFQENAFAFAARLSQQQQHDVSSLALICTLKTRAPLILLNRTHFG
jgi:hypothetical protein